MAMDIFSPEVLDGVISVMPKKPSFFRDTFFKIEKYELEETIRADFYKGKRVIAPFINPEGSAKVVSKIGYSSDTFTTPLIKPKDITTIADLLRRMAGENIYSGIKPEDRAITMLAQTYAGFEEQISRREELMCSQAMLTGKIPVIGENVNYEIDFGFTNAGTASVLWDAANSTADPIADMNAWVLICRKNGYRNPNICIMERSAYNAFLKRCLAIGYLDQKNFLNAYIEPSMKNDNVTFMGRLLDPAVEIYVYDEWYIDDWTSSTPTEKPIIPKGKILLASTNASYSMYYGSITFMDKATDTFRTIIGARGADSWTQKDPDARFLTLAARPLPVPHEVDSWYVATVSATE